MCGTCSTLIAILFCHYSQADVHQRFPSVVESVAYFFTGRRSVAFVPLPADSATEDTSKILGEEEGGLEVTDGKRDSSAGKESPTAPIEAAEILPSKARGSVTKEQARKARISATIMEQEDGQSSGESGDDFLGTHRHWNSWPKHVMWRWCFRGFHRGESGGDERT